MLKFFPHKIKFYVGGAVGVLRNLAQMPIKVISNPVAETPGKRVITFTTYSKVGFSQKSSGRSEGSTKV